MLDPQPPVFLRPIALRVFGCGAQNLSRSPTMTQAAKLAGEHPLEVVRQRRV